jgi:phosphoglycerate dehydrogenase-like enzyme
VPEDFWKDATVVLTLRALPPQPSDAPLLEFIQLYSAGSNQLEGHPIYKDTDIPIATASGVHGPQIAEWVIMTHLVHTHKYNLLYEAQKERKWAEGGPFSVRDSVGMRVGVLGYGSIGRQVGRVAKAMGKLYC